MHVIKIILCICCLFELPFFAEQRVSFLWEWGSLSFNFSLQDLKFFCKNREIFHFCKILNTDHFAKSWIEEKTTCKNLHDIQVITHTDTNTQRHTQTQSHTQTNTHTQTQTDRHTHTHTHVHTQTHRHSKDTDTHTHTHTLGRPIFWKSSRIKFDGPLSSAMTYSKRFGEKILVKKVVLGTPRAPWNLANFQFLVIFWLFQ